LNWIEKFKIKNWIDI